jgi:hypothetical protein
MRKTALPVHMAVLERNAVQELRSSVSKRRL